MRIHLAELLGLLEPVRTAVRRILAIEIEVSTSLAGCISIALDLPPLALITECPSQLWTFPLSRVERNAPRQLGPANLPEFPTQWTHHAIEIYLFLFALVCALPFALVPISSFFLFFPLSLPVSAGLSALEDCRCPFMLRDTAAGDIGVMGESTR